VKADHADREYVQGVERGFAVIKAFSADAPSLTIAQAAARTNLTRAVARRYLKTLEKLGYVHHEGDVFFPTPRLLDLGYAYLVTLTVADIARPYLDKVVRRLTNAESSSLAVLDGHECIYVARAATKRIISSNLVVGSRLAAHATALGKALLAYLPPDELNQYFRTAPLERLTSRTIYEESKLRRALRKVREQGWAYADEEFVVGRRTIAAPVYDRDGRVTAAVNVAAAVALVSTREMLEEHLPVLLDVAREISSALGANVDFGATPSLMARRS
jgi:IclR family transcriptional regulator, pca regulon regulatory protein